jgi:hypothetical protein
MRIIYFILLTLMLVIPSVACQSGDTQQQRTDMLEYLRSVNLTLNALPQASQSTNPVKDLSGIKVSQANTTPT